MNIRTAYAKYDKWRDGLPFTLAVVLFGWEAFVAGSLILFPSAIVVMCFFALGRIVLFHLFGG